MTNNNFRIALWLIVLVTVIYLITQSLGALFPFAVAAIVAYALSPLVDRMTIIFPSYFGVNNKIKRGLSVLIIYLTTILAFVVLGWTMIPVILDQIDQFIDTLPEITNEAQKQINSWLEVYRNRTPTNIQAHVDSSIDQVLITIANTIQDLMIHTINIFTSSVTTIIGFVVVPFWMFYVLRDRPNVKPHLLKAVPQKFQIDVANLLAVADDILGKYIRAQLLLGLIVGVSVAVALTALNIQLSLALGFFAGVTELIPFIGPVIGAIPALIIVAATAPEHFIWVVLIYFLIQQIENSILVPRIQGHALSIHPAVILLLLAIGATTFGIIGLIVVVPLAAVLREIFWYIDRRLSGQSPSRALRYTRIGQKEQENIHTGNQDQFKSSINENSTTSQNRKEL
ncbi:MAG: hypothetical protein CL752_01765 [Chloroflexi bacterium]|nr:hypothetical protein [Chloroflexota bacterium]